MREVYHQVSQWRLSQQESEQSLRGAGSKIFIKSGGGESSTPTGRPGTPLLARPARPALARPAFPPRKLASKLPGTFSCSPVETGGATQPARATSRGGKRSTATQRAARGSASDPAPATLPGTAFPPKAKSGGKPSLIFSRLGGFPLSHPAWSARREGIWTSSQMDFWGALMIRNPFPLRP
jgi:hypothetical protein